MKKLILILTLVITSVAFLSADVYVKQQTTGPQPSTTETWFGTNKMATVSDAVTMIMDVGKKKIFIVSHKNKSYVETTIPLDMTKLMPEQALQMMKAMMDGMTVTLTPNNQTKKVANWNTKGYDFTIGVMGMEMKMTMWAAKDVPFDWKKYMSMYSEIYKVSFNMGEKFMKEFAKIDGFPVETEMNMMGQNFKTTTLEISKKAPGPGVYSVPAGYTKKDKLETGGMR